MICRFEHGGLCCNSGSRHYEYECKKCECMIPISNAERIRSMTDEELAELLSKPWCDNHRFDSDCRRFKADCVACAADWLSQQYEEDT